MPLLYHGTSQTLATAMAGNLAAAGTIDVTRGRGEFGRGFYTQSSSSNAYRRGQSLYGSNNSAMLVLDIDDVSYHGLSFQRLTLNRAQALNTALRNNNTQGTYTTNHDVIIGPLVSQARIEQQKFQTVGAETLLNGVRTQRTVV
jgi:hypothetical protein